MQLIPVMENTCSSARVPVKAGVLAQGEPAPEEPLPPFLRTV